MRIVVISDTHGDEYLIPGILRRQPEAAAAVFLGDGISGLWDAADGVQSGISWYVARGNNDFGRPAPDRMQAVDSGLEILGDKRIFYTHGHNYGVKGGLTRLLYAAEERNADILMFGHTHKPLVDYADGLHIINPGSVAYTRTYGIVDITPAGIVPHIINISWTGL